MIWGLVNDAQNIEVPSKADNPFQSMSEWADDNFPVNLLLFTSVCLLAYRLYNVKWWSVWHVWNTALHQNRCQTMKNSIFVFGYAGMGQHLLQKMWRELISFQFWSRTQRYFEALLGVSEFSEAAFALKSKRPRLVGVWLCLLLKEPGHSGMCPSHIFFFLSRRWWKFRERFLVLQLIESRVKWVR